jgi:hypothetical protein
MLERPRLWTPPALCVALAAGAFTVMRTAPPAIAGGSALVYAACLVFGPGVVYVVLRRRGAPARRAVAGALLVALLWLAKECWAIWNVFGWREAVYYAVNPLALGLLTAAALQMALAEILLRRARERRWQVVNGAGAVVLAVALLAAAYASVALRHDASYIFWVYVSIHRDFVADRGDALGAAGGGR